MQLENKWIISVRSTIFLTLVGAIIGVGVYGCRKEEPQPEKQIESVEHPAEDYTPPKAPVSLGSYKDCKIVGVTGLRGNKEVCVMDYDGSNLTNLTNTPFGFDEDYPSWSPDGRKIMYCTGTPRTYRGRSSQPAYAGEIYVMNVDGTEKQNLTNNPALDYHSSWSPDGKKILFISKRDGNKEIYVMNADGTDQRNLTHNPAIDDYASWSPDGSKIVFVSHRDRKENDRNIEIYVMNADGTNQRNLTNHPGRDQIPSWSPDGSRIGFSSTRDNNEDIYIMNADGSGIMRLTDYRGADEGILWWPDGKKIIFISNRESPGEQFGYDTYIMNADGSEQQKFLDGFGIFSGGGSHWSPDGEKILFFWRGWYTMNPDSTEKQLFASKGMMRLSWSPFLPLETLENNVQK